MSNASLHPDIPLFFQNCTGINSISPFHFHWFEIIEKSLRGSKSWALWMIIIPPIIAVLTSLSWEEPAPGETVKKAQCVAGSVVCHASFSTSIFLFHLSSQCLVLRSLLKWGSWKQRWALLISVYLSSLAQCLTHRRGPAKASELKAIRMRFNESSLFHLHSWHH